MKCDYYDKTSIQRINTQRRTKPTIQQTGKQHSHVCCIYFIVNLNAIQRPRTLSLSVCARDENIVVNVTRSTSSSFAVVVDSVALAVVVVAGIGLTCCNNSNNKTVMPSLHQQPRHAMATTTLIRAYGTHKHTQMRYGHLCCIYYMSIMSHCSV